jgi:hypothetical protein
MNGYNVNTKILKNNSQETEESETNNNPTESPKKYRFIFKNLFYLSIFLFFFLVFIGIMLYR